jgi:hypothetical protein
LFTLLRGKAEPSTVSEVDLSTLLLYTSLNNLFSEFYDLFVGYLCNKCWDK